MKSLALGALLAAAGPALAQDTAISAAGKAASSPAKTVEGATPDRVALVKACGGHKFESVVEIDPVSHRSTRVKLCSKPGASDADWVKTLEAAIVQIEARDMPPAAREQLIAALKAEIGRQGKPGPAGRSGMLPAPPLILGNGLMTASDVPREPPFETSVLPPLTRPKPKPGAKSVAVIPVKPIRASLRCLSRGESGKGATCDFFEEATVLAITPSDALTKGATIRFLRRGEDRGTVEIAPTAAGQTRRIALPVEVCRGISYSKVEVQLLAPGETRVGARFGPYGLRC